MIGDRAMALTQRKNSRLSRAESGQGMVEAILAIPALLALVSMVFQLFFLAAAQVQLQYAAFCAARVGAVRGENQIEEMETAAGRVLSSGIGFAPLYPGAFSVQVLKPPVGKDERAAERDVEAGTGKPLQVQVRWQYPLLVPMAGQILGLSAGRSLTPRGPSLPLKALWNIPGVGDPSVSGDDHVDSAN